MDNETTEISSIRLDRFDPVADTTSPIYRFITHPDAPNRRLLERPPHKGDMLEETPELCFLEHIRAIHRGVAGVPYFARCIEASRHRIALAVTHESAQTYIDLVVRLGVILSALPALLNKSYLSRDAAAQYLYDFESVTADRPAEETSTGDRDVPDYDPDADSDTEGENFALAENAVVGQHVHKVTVRDSQTIIDFYEAADVFAAYPIQNFLARIFATLRCIIKHPTPTFQRYRLDTLATEIIDMIASYLCRDDQMNLGLTSKIMRGVCKRRTQRRATFVTWTCDETIKANRRKGMSTANAFLHALSESCADLVASINNWLVWDSYRHNVRELEVVNHWVVMTPGYADSPSLHHQAVFGKVYDAICTILVSTKRLTSIRLRGFGLTYAMLDRIAAIRDLQTAHFDRCHPVAAGLDPLSVRHTVQGITDDGTPTTLEYTSISAAMTTITRLTLGFNEPELWRRTWNVIALCTGLARLYCYASDTRNGFGFAPRELWKGLDLARLKDVTLENCSSNLSDFIDCCNVGDNALSTGWERFKIRTARAFSVEHAELLVQCLGKRHTALQVLIIDGLRHVPSSLIDSIAVSCPGLHALAISRRARDASYFSGSCIWDEPIPSYARALGQFPIIRHFTANFIWTPADDGGIDDSTGTGFPSPLMTTDEASAYEDLTYILDEVDHNDPVTQWDDMQPVETDDDSEDLLVWDPFDLAFKFYCSAPSLWSFAVRSTVDEFRVLFCDNTGQPGLMLFPNPVDDPEHHEWNPKHASAWGGMTAW